MATLLATPNNLHRFVNWSGDIQGTENPIQVTVTADMNVVANFEAVTYTLTLDSAFGDPQVAGEYPGGEDVQWSVTSPWPSAAGENGVRWIADSASGQIRLDSNKLISVNWTKQRFLEINSQYGDPQGGGWYPEGEEVFWQVTTPYVITSNEERFTTTTPSGTKLMTSSEPVIVEWKREWFLQISSEPGGIVDRDSAWYDHGALVSATANPSSNYQFSRWFGDVPSGKESDNPLTLAMDQSRSVSASFSLVSHTVSVSAENGNVEGGGTFVHGSVALLTAIPEANYRFVKWTGDVQGTANPIQVTVDEDRNIVAIFELDTYTLTIESAFGDPKGAGEYNNGEEVSWSVTSPFPSDAGENGVRRIADSANGTVIMDRDISIRVNWSEQFFVDIQAKPGGTVNLGSGWYGAGRVLSLEASAADLFGFSRWTGDIPEEKEFDNPLSITVTGSFSVVAEFLRITSETAEFELNPGWNSIGIEFDYFQPQSSVFSGVIWKWVGDRFTAVTGPLLKGKGYWLYSKDGGILTLQRLDSSSM